MTGKERDVGTIKIRTLDKKPYTANTQKRDHSLTGAGVSDFGGGTPWGTESDFSGGMLNGSFVSPKGMIRPSSSKVGKSANCIQLLL